MIRLSVNIQSISLVFSTKFRKTPYAARIKKTVTWSMKYQGILFKDFFTETNVIIV